MVLGGLWKVFLMQDDVTEADLAAAASQTSEASAVRPPTSNPVPSPTVLMLMLYTHATAHRQMDGHF